VYFLLEDEPVSVFVDSREQGAIFINYHFAAALLLGITG